MRAAFLFEVKGIQSFLFAGGRLRDAIGASAAVDAVAATRRSGDLASLLDALVKSDDALVPGGLRELRRAAGAFRIVLFGRDAEARARRLSRLAAMMLPSVVPGVDFIGAIGTGATVADAVEAAQRALLARRGLNPVFDPSAGPLVERAPRFGTPAVGFVSVKNPGATEDVWEPADLALTVKKPSAGSRELVKRFVPTASIGDWPFEVEDILEGHEGARIVGVVHADGNRLGAAVRALGDRLDRPAPGEADGLSASEEAWARAYLDFSVAIESATRRACERASRLVVDNRVGDAKLPMRPLIQAGDDVTVIVRGDLALGFAERFLIAFHEETSSALTALFGELRLGAPPELTACAGVALIGASQPFADAHGLAEDLCKFAKAEAKARVGDDEMVPSAIAFHRVTSSLVRDYDEVLERELEASGKRLTFGPYVAGEKPIKGLPALGDLIDLLEVTSREDARRGPLRKFATLVYDAPEEAGRQFERFRKVARTNTPGLIEDFEAALAKLVGRPDKLFAEDGRTPLGDVLALQALKAEVAR